MAVIFECVRAANAAFDADDTTRCAELRSTAIDLTSALGLYFEDTSIVGSDITALAKQLDEARAAKDFATADAIRTQLQDAGYVVETTKEGTRVRRG